MLGQPHCPQCGPLAWDGHAVEELDGPENRTHQVEFELLAPQQQIPPHLFFVELIWGGSEMLGQMSDGAQISFNGFRTFAVENEIFTKPPG
jgi:hypothetical protein